MSFIFLDRDGVINRFPGKGVYVTRLSNFVFLPGSKKAIQLLADAGHTLAVISNQGCVSRGTLTREGLKTITARMLAGIKKSGGKLRGVYYCMHQASDKCGCKKPKLGLIKKAVKRRPGALINSIFIGDSREDMQAAKKAGCLSILVLSGRSKKKDIADFEFKPDEVKKNLLEAARWILKRRS